MAHQIIAHQSAEYGHNGALMVVLGPTESEYSYAKDDGWKY